MWLGHNYVKYILCCEGDQTVEKNLELWEEMIKGTDLGRTCVVRAKMKYDDEWVESEGVRVCAALSSTDVDRGCSNSALRDPAMYRCKPEPHHRTGTRFKVYPLYDFACPIIDSLGALGFMSLFVVFFCSRRVSVQRVSHMRCVRTSTCCAIRCTIGFALK